MPPSPSRLIKRLPAYALNGIQVAAGVGAIQIVFALLAGPLAAQLAGSGAVCTSLADLPTTAGRSRQRVLAAALATVAAAALVEALRPHPLALGLGVAFVPLVSMMAIAWGPRAGPVSFAPVLSMLFAMSLPRELHLGAMQVLWNALGAATYLAWSAGTAAVLQPRYRRLALVSALRATAQLFRSRAGVLESPRFADDASSTRMRAWIGDEATLAEQLQAARDLLFDVPDTPATQRDTAVLLHAIDLRDVLLASRLDLDLLGDDELGRLLLRHVAEALRRIADSLHAAGDALMDGDASSLAGGDLPDPAHAFDQVHVRSTDPRSRLLPAISSRLGHLTRNVSSIRALLRGEPHQLPLTQTQLRMFVAPEGWPLAAVKAQLTFQSPVLRHALRTSLALGSAYFLALALPWASHPHWLVLSVAVVLRGNLEQTLTRRNARVFGTMLGCVVVLALSRLSALEHLIFLAAVGVAHSFINVRYLVTATAATVMALLQAHLVDPGAPIPIAERLADTLLGAALAWGFSYVLPSWERRSLPKTVHRTLLALQEYASLALTIDADSAVQQRLARRRAYDAIGALAAAVQRSAFEPERVRVPVVELTTMIDNAQRVMAHLSVIRLMLVRRRGEIDRPEVPAAVQSAAGRLAGLLDPRKLAEGDPPQMPTVLGLESLPVEPPMSDPVPWLLRRLQVAAIEAGKVRRASRATLGALKNRPA